MTKLEAFGEFVRIAHDIWNLSMYKNPGPPDFTLDETTRLSPRLSAGLWVCRNPAPQAIWYGPKYKPTLYRWCPNYRLLLSDRLMSRGDDVIRKVLIHEALHIGFVRHDATFKAVCKHLGGAMSELQASGIVLLQIKPNNKFRFETLKEFGTVPEAQAWLDAHRSDLDRQYPMGGRLRLRG